MFHFLDLKFFYSSTLFFLFQPTFAALADVASLRRGNGKEPKPEHRPLQSPRLGRGKEMLKKCGVLIALGMISINLGIIQVDCKTNSIQGKMNAFSGITCVFFMDYWDSLLK